MGSKFSAVATEVQQALKGAPARPSTRKKRSGLAMTAADVKKHFAAADRDKEWQRVNSYIADVLKDAHVLYAKLARLQGDFAGGELDQLQKISEAVLVLGDELSTFSKSFYDGKYMMQESEFTYGEEGGAPMKNPDAGKIPPPAEKGPPPPGLFGDEGEGGEGGEQPQAPAGEAEEGGEEELAEEEPAEEEAAEEEGGEEEAAE